MTKQWEDWMHEWEGIETGVAMTPTKKMVTEWSLVHTRKLARRQAILFGGRRVLSGWLLKQCLN